MKEISFVMTKIDDQLVNSVDARTLHQALESKRDFTAWVKAKILDNFFLVEGKDYAPILEHQEKDDVTCLLTKSGEQTCNFDDRTCNLNGNTGHSRGGHNRKDYALTFDAAKKIAMAEQTSKGNDVREYFLECEQQRDELIEKKFIHSEGHEKPLPIAEASVTLLTVFETAKNLGLPKDRALNVANSVVSNMYHFDYIDLMGLNHMLPPPKEVYFSTKELAKKTHSTKKIINLFLEKAGLQKQFIKNGVRYYEQTKYGLRHCERKEIVVLNQDFKWDIYTLDVIGLGHDEDDSFEDDELNLAIEHEKKLNEIGGK